VVAHADIGFLVVFVTIDQNMWSFVKLTDLHQLIVLGQILVVKIQIGFHVGDDFKPRTFVIV
jgi:hypothetical protein